MAYSLIQKLVAPHYLPNPNVSISKAEIHNHKKLSLYVTLEQYF